MYNWLGQEIKVGSVVGRGARDGNTSTFKIGRVIKLNTDKQTARVEWQYSSSAIWKTVPDGHYYDGSPKYKNEYIYGFYPNSRSWGATGVGSPSVESLFVFPNDTLDRAARMEKLAIDVCDRCRAGIDVTKQDWLDAVANL